MKILYVIIFLFLMRGNSAAQQFSLNVVKAGKSEYVIIIPAEASENEKKAARILQRYFQKVTGALLPVSTVAGDKPAISVGSTVYQSEVLSTDTFTISNNGKNIILAGNGHRGILFAVYHFIENYLKCRKWAPNEPAECPKIRDIRINLPVDIIEKASFDYREVYSTAELDEEYMDWYKLHRLDDYWGLWGHSFSTLVPNIFFKKHPDYFSLSRGKRTSQQLCLSHPKVLQLTLEKLEILFKENPDQKFWSISPNDNSSHCECGLCSAVNRVEGGPQGSLIKFVNKIAASYPEKTFTTISYGATARAPLRTKPLPNVIILLSNIEIFRNEPVETGKSAAAFRNNLKDWLQITPHVYVWDYYTQFTNYLAPFPDFPNAGSNVHFYKKNKIKGVFAQLGDQNYVDQVELKSYILARKLWNEELDNEMLFEEFVKGYYGEASVFVRDYLLNLRSNVEKSGRKLDIYGNPVKEHDAYLSSKQLAQYEALLDRAESASVSKTIRARIRKLRLSLDYTRLQQAKFFGKDAHGIYSQSHSGKWEIRSGLKKKVHDFGLSLKSAGITQLSEGGQTAQSYIEEWSQIFQKEIPVTLATGAAVSFEKPWIPDYPAKRTRTLTDGMYGMHDFSLNWLLFEGSNTITLDLRQETYVTSITPNFLEDQRHWIFLPKKVSVSVSADGLHYNELSSFQSSVTQKKSVTSYPVTFTAGKKIKYIKISIDPLPQLPEWKSHPSKSPLVAIDEIWVE
ncbi:DUF4838 domain-containing protein [Kaistella sp. PBT33-4]|uniref:DUF4838 domain-containing protein n=1 Tax=Kaistella sp. PBT33-4 TaxID=3032000 RepID=UPI0023D7DEA0|nr:DUF4838 domain-containing protein [Kaistella sp. PBT33-4]MDF0720309.1 DUF4838 domain-containing protein [Kaistella sp. PBT33-4]